MDNNFTPKNNIVKSWNNRCIILFLGVLKMSKVIEIKKEHEFTINDIANWIVSQENPEFTLSVYTEEFIIGLSVKYVFDVIGLFIGIYGWDFECLPCVGEENFEVEEVEKFIVGYFQKYDISISDTKVFKVKAIKQI